MKCFTPIQISGPPKRIVPCNRCYACLYNRRQEWYCRIKEELKNGVGGYFVTLTYSSKYLPKTQDGLSYVSKKDCQLFIKRLRKVIKSPIKYYLSSEYGPNTYRPHYHAIFLTDYDEISFTKAVANAWSKQLKNDDNTFSDDRESFGFIEVDTVNDNRIGYVCGYIMDSKKETKSGEKVFALMSKGLGKEYLQQKDRIDWHKTDPLDHNYYPDYDKKKRLPRYIRDKIWEPVTHYNPNSGQLEKNNSAKEIINGMSEKSEYFKYLQKTVHENIKEWKKESNKRENAWNKHNKRLKSRTL